MQVFYWKLINFFNIRIFKGENFYFSRLVVISGDFAFVEIFENFFLSERYSLTKRFFNLIQDKPFRGCSQTGWGAKSPPFPKICHTYTVIKKFGTVIFYLKKIQKVSELRDTSLEFCWHQHFFIGNQQILLYQEIQI